MNQRKSATSLRTAGPWAGSVATAAGVRPELSHLCERLETTVEAIEPAAGMQELRGGKLLGEARRRLKQVRERHMLPLVRLTRRLLAGDTHT